MEEIQAAKQVLKEARNSRAVSDRKCTCIASVLLSHRNVNPYFLSAVPFTV